MMIEGLIGSDAAFLGVAALVERPAKDQALHAAEAGDRHTIREFVDCNSPLCTTIVRQRQRNPISDNDVQAMAVDSFIHVEPVSRDSGIEGKNRIWIEKGFSTGCNVRLCPPLQALIVYAQPLYICADSLLEAPAATDRRQAAGPATGGAYCSHLVTGWRQGKFVLRIFFSGEPLDFECPSAGTLASRMTRCCSFVSHIGVDGDRQIHIHLDRGLLIPALYKRIQPAPIEDRKIPSRRTPDTGRIQLSETDDEERRMLCPLAPRMDAQIAIICLPEPTEDEMLPETMATQHVTQKMGRYERGCMANEGTFQLRCSIPWGMSTRLEQVLMAIRSGDTL
ncbi:conserved hypothetical protein [Neospora caninum Liverpool]|uniref:Uncharacterized protein n=1 Tax=Neospora caninum (strain Liverpool) TaxID=572307 RepID=F0VLV8_NEOCL|nr:conserved hypothetical protein [Neospora caninum Liverpool]CBZ54236.1 conserved hypothetical protein [Neospora caninum Liverpool]CEL68939.1 TPA: hypothetical protein BN1204_046680 [Neospora caninum Liverpool]|eukprot:XP_003884267.1 conserved hypothetical protein [Neospora caninum Liverpool]